MAAQNAEASRLQAEFQAKQAEMNAKLAKEDRQRKEIEAQTAAALKIRREKEAAETATKLESARQEALKLELEMKLLKESERKDAEFVRQFQAAELARKDAEKKTAELELKLRAEREMSAKAQKDALIKAHVVERQRNVELGMSQDAEQKRTESLASARQAGLARQKQIEAESKNMKAANSNVQDERLLWLTVEESLDPTNRTIIAEVKKQFKLMFCLQSDIDRCNGGAFTLTDVKQQRLQNSSMLDPPRLLTSADLTPEEDKVWETRHTLQKLIGSLPQVTEILLKSCIPSINEDSSGRYRNGIIEISRRTLCDKRKFASIFLSLIALAQCGASVLSEKYEDCLHQLLGQVAVAKMESSQWSMGTSPALAQTLTSPPSGAPATGLDLEARPSTLEKLQEALFNLKLQNNQLKESLKQQNDELDEIKAKLKSSSLSSSPSSSPSSSLSSSSSSSGPESLSEYFAELKSQLSVEELVQDASLLGSDSAPEPVNKSGPDKMSIQLRMSKLDSAKEKRLKVKVFVDTPFHKVYDLDCCKPPPGKVTVLHHRGVHLEIRKTPQDYDLKEMDLVEVSFIEEKELSARIWCKDSKLGGEVKLNAKEHNARRGATAKRKLLRTSLVQVRIRNAEGPNAGLINGTFTRSDGLYNDHAIFSKDGDTDWWLVYAKNNYWMVTDTESKVANDTTGYASSVNSGMSLPTETSLWQVLVDDEYVQQAISVTPISEQSHDFLLQPRDAFVATNVRQCRKRLSRNSNKSNNLIIDADEDTEVRRYHKHAKRDDY